MGWRRFEAAFARALSEPILGDRVSREARELRSASGVARGLLTRAPKAEQGFLIRTTRHGRPLSGLSPASNPKSGRGASPVFQAPPSCPGLPFVV